MKAFTITTRHEEWNQLTRECVLRLRAYAGMDTEPITADNEFDSHVQKLTVPLASHEPTWFFDSDWWMVKEATLPPIPSGGIVATYCRSGHERYCNTCVDISQVFGTTIYGADLSSVNVRQAFLNALKLQSEFYWNGRPKADESFLNIACQRLNVPIAFMPPEWNWCDIAQDNTIAVHAGAMWPKLEWLKARVQTCHREKLPLLSVQ